MRKSAEDSVDCMISSNTSDKRSSCHTTPNGLPIVPKATFLWLCLLLMFSRCSSLDELGDKASGISESYEELKFDHEVSEQDAEQALRKLNASKPCISYILRSLRMKLLTYICMYAYVYALMCSSACEVLARSLLLSLTNNSPVPSLFLVARAGIQNSCNSMDCGQYLDYCWTPQFEKDHCWCELQHREGEPTMCG